MSVRRSIQFVRKAEEALLSAIEVYNRPTFAYREETFAILALNAWELLLKAKLLAENSDKPNSLYTFEHHVTKAGQPSKKRYLKKNRSGAPLTHSLLKTISELENKTKVRVDQAIKTNLEALRVAEKHYAPWVKSRQESLTAEIEKAWKLA